MAGMGPGRVKTRRPGRQFMNFSRFSTFSAITGSAKRKNSLQMRRFQTISEFSHSLDPKPEQAEQPVRHSLVASSKGSAKAAEPASHGMRVVSQSPDPLGKMHTMTKR